MVLSVAIREATCHGIFKESALRPIISISHDVRLSACVSVCPLPMRFFCVRELVWSVTRPWTGAERPLPSRGALKTGGVPRPLIGPQIT